MSDYSVESYVCYGEKVGFRYILKNAAVKFAAALFAVAAVIVIGAQTAYAVGSTAIISGDSVNVRVSPNTNAEVVRQYDSGDSIDIVGLENGWYKIREPRSSTGFAYVTGEWVNVVQVDAYINDDRVNIRDSSSTDGKVLGTLSKGDSISIVGSEGSFYLFNMGGKTGYVFKGFVDGNFLGYVSEQEAVKVITIPPEVEPVSVMIEATYGLVTPADGVNFRASPNQNAEIIFALPYDDVVDILETGTEWHRVAYAGIEGYVKAEFLNLKTGQKPDRDARTSKANAIINFARKYLGTPYVWGGTNLNRGVDCSGFTYSVFKNFGYSLNRSSRDQIHNGTRVSRSQLMAGDLVFFDTNGGGGISHVGIYIGGGDFIHSCSGSRTMCVTISNLGEAYYSSRFVAGARIFN